MFSSKEMFAKRSIEKLKDTIGDLKFMRIFFKSVQSFFLDLPFLSTTTSIQKVLFC